MAGSLFINSLIFQVTVCVVLFSEIQSYSELTLENAKLCKIKEDAGEATVRLGREQSSVAIVTQKKYFTSWSGRYNFYCSFQVRALKDHGLYAVIQLLNFRKNESTGECKDYIEIKNTPHNFLDHFTFKDPRPKRFCGRLYAGQFSAGFNGDIDYDTDDINNEEVSNNGYVSHDGSITVTIYVATERLSENERLDMKIAFTSFKKECFWQKEHYKSNYIKCNSCEYIWKGLENDDIQNCPYDSCRDEDFCKKFKPPFEGHDVVSSGTGTKVTVGAVATIIILFLMFATCLWGCRRNQRCCWSPAVSNSSRIELNRTRQGTDVNATAFDDVPPPGSTEPSAPPISEIKDMPPSYESLFPPK